MNRYDFAYAGRDTVNQIATIATVERINQIISQGGKEVELVLPKILRAAIEDVHQTPFRLPRDFGKQQLNKILKKDVTLRYFYFFVIVYTWNQSINYKIKMIFKSSLKYNINKKIKVEPTRCYFLINTRDQMLVIDLKKSSTTCLFTEHQ